MKRKPPIRHTVRTHKREGKVVQTFKRGSGVAPKRKSVVVGDKTRQRHKTAKNIQHYFKGEEGSFGDASIVDHLMNINKAGIETSASCSGVSADHPGENSTYAYGEGRTGSYLSVTLPEDVVERGWGGGIFKIPEGAIKNPAYIYALKAAGDRAGWVTKLTKYMMFLPTLHFSLPISSSPEGDRKALQDPDFVTIQLEINSHMGKNTKESSDKFLDALHRRDPIGRRAYAKYGGDIPKSDKQIAKYWDALTRELIKVSPRLKSLR